MNRTSLISVSLFQETPFAVEKATIDLINEHTGKDYFRHIWPEIDYIVQLNHAHEIGLGNLDYELENVTAD